MAHHDRNYLEENQLEAYQFLFELPQADKQILSDYTKLESVEQWQAMVVTELKGTLPPYNLLDKIHLDYIGDGCDWNTDFEPIDLERVQQIVNEVEKKNKGVSNMVEVNTLALIESLRQSEPA